jgi:hypothetical protein
LVGAAFEDVVVVVVGAVFEDEVVLVVFLLTMGTGFALELALVLVLAVALDVPRLDEELFVFADEFSPD